MASCPKCGKHPLKKPKIGPRACPRCGMTAQTLRVIEYVKAQEASSDLYQDRPSFFPVAAKIVGRDI